VKNLTACVCVHCVRVFIFRTAFKLFQYDVVVALLYYLSPPQSLLKYLQITYTKFPEWKRARAVLWED
jgi:hypothetical protein